MLETRPRVAPFVAVAIVAYCAVGMIRAASIDALSSRQSPGQHATTYLGFDRNEYPGDDALPSLHTTFAYAGFWLNNPPGATRNTWTGKRKMLLAHDFGFLVLFNGRLDKQIKAASDPAALGRADAVLAAKSAASEGFPKDTIIFLDLEEGGRMLPEQKAYIYAWVDSLTSAGFRAGIYCSGIPAPDEKGHTVVTAEDLRQNAAGREIVFWVANDACPPSPGCSFPRQPPAPNSSRVSFARVWQYAQSPRRPHLTRNCSPTYAQDGNCYAPGLSSTNKLFLDLNSAGEPDPSHGGTP